MILLTGPDQIAGFTSVGNVEVLCIENSSNVHIHISHGFMQYKKCDYELSVETWPTRPSRSWLNLTLSYKCIPDPGFQLYSQQFKEHIVSFIVYA